MNGTGKARTSRAEFAAAVAPLYRQFGWRDTEEAREAHVEDRFRLLSAYAVGTIDEAVEKLLISETRMPTVAVMRQALVDASRRRRAAWEARTGGAKVAARPYDPNGCLCGCGGIRWARAMAEIIPGVARSRDVVECRRQGLHPVPVGDPAWMDERGIPVYGAVAESGVPAE